MRTAQFPGVPEGPAPDGIEAGAISLKSRTAPIDEAVADGLAALDWLPAQGCRCSALVGRAPTLNTAIRYSADIGRMDTHVFARRANPVKSASEGRGKVSPGAAFDYAGLYPSQLGL